MSNLRYGILFPVYNEEKRLPYGIEKAYSYFEELAIDFSLIIVDNNSTDRTFYIAKEYERLYDRVTVLRAPEKGVGAAFYYGVINSDTDIIGYMDIDLAADITHFQDVICIFEKYEDVELVNGSRFNKESVTTGRIWYRNITSMGLIVLLKLFFGMKSSDAICGFKFFRRKTLLKIINQSVYDASWFYIIEILLRYEKAGIRMYELPVRYHDDAINSKVEVIKTIKNYLHGMIRLKYNLREK